MLAVAKNMNYVRACYKVVKAVTRRPWSPWVSSFLMKRSALPRARLEAVGAKPSKAHVRKGHSFWNGLPQEGESQLSCYRNIAQQCARASLLSNNFASKWWAHCTLLPLLDEGWGGVVDVGPSAAWSTSAPRKWEPRPCRAQRAGYRDTQKNLRNSVNLLHGLFHF